jgi:hypothetical protein
METNKENVSPIKGLVNADNEVDCLTSSLQNKLDINGIEKDGRYFLDAMKKETDRLNRLCETTEKAMNEEGSPSDEGKSTPFMYFSTYFPTILFLFFLPSFDTHWKDIEINTSIVNNLYDSHGTLTSLPNSWKSQAVFKRILLHAKTVLYFSCF